MHLHCIYTIRSANHQAAPMITYTIVLDCFCLQSWSCLLKEQLIEPQMYERWYTFDMCGASLSYSTITCRAFLCSFPHLASHDCTILTDEFKPNNGFQLQPWKTGSTSLNHGKHKHNSSITAPWLSAAFLSVQRSLGAQRYEHRCRAVPS